MQIPYEFNSNIKRLKNQKKTLAQLNRTRKRL